MPAKAHPPGKPGRKRVSLTVKRRTVARARPKAKKGSGTGAASPPATSAGAALGWTKATGEVGIRVRMYRVGFGDFFLVSLLDGAGNPLHVVIDCGVFKGTSQTGDIGSIEAAVADLVQVTGGEVALIIMTHRHADHIAGFARCAEQFKALTVGAVWMPVWENEYDSTAVKFQAELTRTALGLQRHFTALGANASEEENTARKFMENAVGELDGQATGVAASGSNAVALDLLKHRLGNVTPSYYQAGATAELPEPLIDAGLSAQILGPPPVTDLDLMKLMDLQKSVGQYLAGEDGEAGDAFAPFGSEWTLDPAKAPARGSREFYTPGSFREWVRPRRSSGPVTPEEAARARAAAERALGASQPIAALIAATQLNSFLNNQSLVILFAFKGKKLLFVGDAQAGNWEHWLFESDTPDNQASGTMAVAAQQILASLDFYKVGHHGSSNATPKAAAETMVAQQHRFVALCSTEAGVYGTEHPEDPSKGTEVPRGPLLGELASEAALVRSDQLEITVNGEKIAPAVEEPLPAAPPGTRFEQGAIWIDCYL